MPKSEKDSEVMEGKEMTINLSMELCIIEETDVSHFEENQLIDISSKKNRLTSF